MCQLELVLTAQDHEGQSEPAPPLDTDMLTDDAVPHVNQNTVAESNNTPVQQQAPQVQQPPAASNPNIQSSFFAAALAQAMAALPQQQGECQNQMLASASLPEQTS